MHHLKNKIIWVTGGAGYLGSAITRALDEEGAKVFCFDLPGKAQALVHQHNLTQTTPLALDVNNADTLPAAIESLVAAHGLPDGVVHLSVASSSGHRLETLPASEFQKTFDLALTSTFVLCRELGERMKKRGTGSIVLFASMYGMVAPDLRVYHEPMKPNPIDYGASKAAILQMTRYLAVNYGPSGLRFNSVSPGPFPNPSVQKEYPKFTDDLSNKTALRRIGTNAEIVAPVLFLLDEGSAYVTGHNLVVDGGWTIS